MSANPPESIAAAVHGSNGPIRTRTRVISLFNAAVTITGDRQLTTIRECIKIYCLRVIEVYVFITDVCYRSQRAAGKTSTSAS